MKKFIYSVAALAAATCLSGCIKETFPTDSVLASQIGQSASALEGMVNSIYTNMVGYKNKDGGIETIAYGSLLIQMEHSTTLMLCPGNNGYNTMGNWHYGSIPSTGSNRGIYPSYVYYGYIKTVNDVIGMVDPETTNPEMRADLGICYAYRALYYMDFVQVMEYKEPNDSRYPGFAEPKNDLKNLGVPIVTEKTTNKDASNNPRATVDEVYDLILSDLANAEKYLDGFARKDKIQPNKAVVYGLYARAYTNLASRTETAAKYTNKADLWKKAGEYAEKAIAESGCTPLTEAQWHDPKNGFNNRDSQNSWMLATHIDPNNAAAMTESFVSAMIMGTETTFSVYGWRVGRGLDRAAYERLSDNDWRKKSWLGPEFFYKSANQKEGQPYLVERDASGKFINNVWALGGTNTSTEQSDWSDDALGYQLNSSASWIRSRNNTSMGFKAWPWLYLNLKFRPHEGNWNTYEVGAATDFPIMRVEEMYFIKAEAELNTSGVAAAKNTLEGIIKTRNSSYTCNATSKVDVYEELLFQKGIEFWGEGVNYFDHKRLEVGRHSWYEGCSAQRRGTAIDINNINVGWTPSFNDAEVNGNNAIHDYNNPYTAPSIYLPVERDDAYIEQFYGKAIDPNHKIFDTAKLAK